MRRTFVAVSIAFTSALFIACGGGSRTPYTGDLDFPETQTVHEVNGVHIAGFGVMSADKYKLAEFVDRLANAPDISRNMVRRGEVRKIENGSRVEIKYILEKYEIANVQILDGAYAGEVGFMDARECGATKKVAKPASAQQKTRQ